MENEIVNEFNLVTTEVAKIPSWIEGVEARKAEIKTKVDEYSKLSIKDVKDKEGLKQVKAALRDLVSERVETEKIRLENGRQIKKLKEFSDNIAADFFKIMAEEESRLSEEVEKHKSWIEEEKKRKEELKLNLIKSRTEVILGHIKDAGSFDGVTYSIAGFSIDLMAIETLSDKDFDNQMSDLARIATDYQARIDEKKRIEEAAEVERLKAVAKLEDENRLLKERLEKLEALLAPKPESGPSNGPRLEFKEVTLEPVLAGNNELFIDPELSPFNEEVSRFEVLDQVEETAEEVEEVEELSQYELSFEAPRNPAAKIEEMTKEVLVEPKYKGSYPGFPLSDLKLIDNWRISIVQALNNTPTTHNEVLAKIIAKTKIDMCIVLDFLKKTTSK